jgi:hypothetical protein
MPAVSPFPAGDNAGDKAGFLGLCQVLHMASTRSGAASDNLVWHGGASDVSTLKSSCSVRSRRGEQHGAFHHVAQHLSTSKNALAVTSIVASTTTADKSQTNAGQAAAVRLV